MGAPKFDPKYPSEKHTKSDSSKEKMEIEQYKKKISEMLNDPRNVKKTISILENWLNPQNKKKPRK